MTSGHPPWTAHSANTPPLSSSAAGIIVPRKTGDPSRHKQQMLKLLPTEDVNGGFDAPEGLYLQYLPLSPDPTTLSGQSTGQDASTRYGSRSPDLTSHFNSAVVPEVVVVSTWRAPKAESSQTSTKTSLVGYQPNVTKTYQKKGIEARMEKDASHQTCKKTPAQSQRSTPGKQRIRTGVMSAPKAVLRDDLQPNSNLARLKKRARVEEKNSTPGQYSKRLKLTTDSRQPKHTEHHTSKKMKITHNAATLPVKATSSSTTVKHPSAAGHIRTVISKQQSKSLIQYPYLLQRPKTTLQSAAANGIAASTPSRFRNKEKIDYRIKLPLTLNPPEPKLPGPKSNGKAVRKKIKPAAGEVSVLKRAPSPFPAWHRTTSALNKGRVAKVEMKEVDEIPEDDCYIHIPIYEPKTKLTEPELIPDRFDVRLNHPALQVKDLLRRAVPLQCGWKDCDAVLACEPMLDKHINKCGHISKALVVHHDYFEPDAWICQWEGCEGRAFANQDQLEQHVKAVHVGAVLTCPYENCDEEPSSFPKMSLLGAHVRRNHPSNVPSKCILKPLVGANDNRSEPKRYAGPVPRQSQPYRSIYMTVSRSVWRSEARKKAVIDLVADRSFIDKLDVKMQSGNVEMTASTTSSPENVDAMSDTEMDVDLPEVEEVWKDHEPVSEMPFEPLAQAGATGLNPSCLPVPLVVNASDEPSGTTTPTIDMQKRRSDRLKDDGKALLSEVVSNSVRDPRDPTYCVLIPVTRKWVSLPDGPGSM